jgi:hypothetical protein
LFSLVVSILIQIIASMGSFFLILLILVITFTVAFLWLFLGKRVENFDGFWHTFFQVLQLGITGDFELVINLCLSPNNFGFTN